MERVRTTIDSTTYKVCWNSTAVPLTCSPDIAMGTSYDSDVTGDGVTDVRSTLTPVLNPAYPQGFTGQFSTVRLAGATGTLAAHVYAVYEVPGTTLRMTTGFDASESSLSSSSKVTAVLTDVTKVVANDVQVLVNLTYVSPASPQSVTFSTRSLVPSCASCTTFDEINPILGAIRFDATPSWMSGSLHFRQDGSGGTVNDFTTSLPAATGVEVSLNVSQTSTQARTLFMARAASLPVAANLTLARAANGTTTAAYAASAAIAQVNAYVNRTDNMTHAENYTRFLVEARDVPATVNVTMAPQANLTYAASASMTSLNVTYEDVKSNAPVTRVGANVTGLPTSILFNATTSPGVATIVYDANAATSYVNLSYASFATPTTVALVDVTGLSTHLDLVAYGTSYVSANATPAITQILGNLSIGGQPIDVLPGDHFTINATASGMSMGWRVGSFSQLILDQATAGRLYAKVKAGAGQAFNASVKTPTVLGTAYVSNLPTSIEITELATSLHYVGSGAVSEVYAHVEISGYVLDVDLVNLPADILVTWSTGTSGVITYTASASITRVTARLRKTTLDAGLDIITVPTSLTLTYDASAPALKVVASPAVGTLSGAVNVSGGNADPVPGMDHFVLVQNGSQLGIRFNVSNVTLVEGNASAGGRFALGLSPGGQPFQGLLFLQPSKVGSLYVSSLPASLVADLQPATRTFSYAGVATGAYVRATWDDNATGQKAVLDLVGLPSALSLTWTAAYPIVATYSASGPLGSLMAYSRDATGGKAFNLTVTSIPAWMQATFDQDYASFDARVGATAAPASGSVGSILARYADDDAFLTTVPPEDHAVLVQDAGVTRAEILYTGLRQVVADSRSHQLHVLVKNTAARVFVARADTPSMLAGVHVDAVPSTAQVDYVNNTVWYNGSSNVSRVDVGFDNKTGTLLNATLLGLPTNMTLQWGAQNVTYQGSGPIVSIAAKVAINNGTAPTDAIDHVYLVKNGTSLGIDVLLHGLVALTVDPTNGGLYKLQLSPGGQPFYGYASLDADVVATLWVSNLPTLISADLRAPTKAFVYTGTQSANVTATYRKLSTGDVARLDLQGLPAAMRVDWTMTPTALITYNASAIAGAAMVFYHEGSSGASYNLTVTSIPAWMKAQVAPSLVTFDARTAWNAAPATGSVGQILLRYGSDGNFLTNTPSDDHAVYKENGTGKWAELKYSGLRSLTVQGGSGSFFVNVKNSAARVFVLAADTPLVLFNGRIDAVPDDVTVNYAGSSIHYAASSAISRMDYALDNRAGLLANLTILGLPTGWDLTWAPGGGTGVSFIATGGAVGQILARLSMHGVYAATGGTDHLHVIKRGADVGVDLQLSGLVEITATTDPTNGAYARLRLSPGGQTFNATADLDSDTYATLQIAALPNDVTLSMRPGSGSFSYAGAASGTSLTARLWRVSTGLIGAVDLPSLPASLSLTWAMGPPFTATYDASAPLTGLNAFVRAASAGPTANLAISSLPQHIDVLAGDGQVVFDAKTSAGAASGSGALGTVRLQFATNTVFLGGVPAIDHAWVKKTAAGTWADVQHTGLKQVRIDTRSQKFSALVQDASARPFNATVDTPTAFFALGIANVPANVQVTWDGVTARYLASSVVGQVTAYYSPLDGTYYSADVRNIPASITLALDMTGQAITWTSSSSVTSVTLAARQRALGRTWSATLGLTSIPTAWNLKWPSGGANLTVTSGSIGSVDATLTDTSNVWRLGGDHVAVYYRDVTNDLTASLHVSNVAGAGFGKTTNGFQSELKVGSGGTLSAGFDAVLSGNAANASATLIGFPTLVQLSQTADKWTYAASANFELYLRADVGHAASMSSVPTPPWLGQGVAVRDGACNGCPAAYKSTLHLVGLPTRLVFDGSGRTLSVTSYNPGSSARIQADADLRHTIANSAVRFLFTQSGISGPISYKFGPFSASGHTVSASYTSSAAMGQLDLQAWMYNGNLWAGGYLTLSGIPTSLTYQSTFGNPISTVDITMSSAMTSLRAGAYLDSFSGPGALSVGASVSLTDIPSTVHLTFGRVQQTSGSDQAAAPGFTYSANADTLDVTLWVGATLFGGDLHAVATLYATNIGRSTTGTLSGMTLSIASSPATSSLEAHVYGDMHLSSSASGCWPSCSNWIRLEASEHGTFTPNIQDLRVSLSGFTSATLKIGLASQLSGSFSAFQFGWGSVSIGVDFHAAAYVKLKVASTTLSWTLASYDTTTTLNPRIDFHVSGAHWAPYWSVNTYFPCSWTYNKYHINLNFNPHPHGRQTNGFSVGAPGTENMWVVTPNPGPIFPDVAVDVANLFLGPSGSGASISAPCY
ncbi:MAG: hypothetical protein QOE90_3463 [Thermoplasmata archaeon]|nr:hypothetical protein [Thermoplasmata archaeon]